jgi:lycopene cyclase domain-containing protein
MEYTFLAIVSVAAAVIVDWRLKTGLLKKPLFYLFLAVIAGFKLLVNGFLTSSMIVQYNPAHYMGLRIGSIPVEDFLFGFSMITIAVSLWEYFRRKN